MCHGLCIEILFLGVDRPILVHSPKGGAMRLITKNELAKLLKVNPVTIARLVKSRRLPSCTPWRPRFRETALSKSLAKFYIGHDFKTTATFPRDWLTPFETAETLGVCKATVLRWTRLKKIPFYRFGKHVLRFREQELGDWLHEQEGGRQ